MPAISSIILTDGVTPVTLDPISHVAGETRYRANAAATTAANPTLVYQSKENNGVSRRSVRYTEPYVVTDSSTSEVLVRENIIVEISTRVAGIVPADLRQLAVKRAFDAASVAALEAELTNGEGQW